MFLIRCNVIVLYSCAVCLKKGTKLKELKVWNYVVSFMDSHGENCSPFLQPSFHCPPSDIYLSDQFAFRPTGSTTAAIVTLLHLITSFDTVRHSTLLNKMSNMAIPKQFSSFKRQYLENGRRYVHSQETMWANSTMLTSPQGKFLQHLYRADGR